MENSPLVGIVMDFFVPGIIEGAGAYARECGLSIDSRWAVRADWMPDQPGWDGIMVHLVDRADVWDRIRALGIPVLNLSSRTRDVHPKVETDSAAAGRRAIAEVVDRGIRTVALLEFAAEPVALRFNLGARCEAREREVSVCGLPEWDSEADFETMARRIARSLAGLEGQCAFLCAHAGVVYSVVRHLQDLGTEVPDEVAIVVLDKDVQRTAEMAAVPMSVVRPDFWEHGYVAARLLHRMLRGREYPGRKLIRIRHTDFIERESTGRPTTRDPFVKKVLHGLQESDLRSLSVEGLVRYAGLSRRTLEQRFKKEVGSTLHRAILKRRINEATRLLRAGDATVGEVGDVCGFASLHYFSSAYKRETGKTPGSVRRSG